MLIINPYTFSAAPPATDPYWGNVVLMLGFNGVDAATTTTDEATGKAVTFVGNAQIDTAVKKFGLSSLLLDGNGDRLTLADSDDWWFGAAPFTIEAFVTFRVNDGSANYLLSQWNGAQRSFGIQHFSNGWYFNGTTDGSTNVYGYGPWAHVPVAMTPYHVACTRDAAGTLRFFVDGVVIATQAGVTGSFFNSTEPLWIGAIPTSTPGNDFDGWIDELRITKGIARYTANFTPPAAEFPRSGATALLALNPLDKNAQHVLSNSNRTVTKTTGGTAWGSTRSITSHSAGKWYYEWTPVEMSGSFVGAGFTTASGLLNNYPGSNTSGIALISQGQVFKAGAGTATLPALAEGDVISLAIDLAADLFWCRRNGGLWNNSGTADPATGVGGIALPSGMTTGSPSVFAAVGLQVSPNDQITVNLGDTTFAYAVPSGYSAFG